MTSDQPEGVEHIHTLQIFQDGKASSIKRNLATRQLLMQVGPQRHLFGFSSVLRLLTKLSLHPLQIVYKNNSIPQRLSNARENFGGNNLKLGHCHVLNLGFIKEISSLSNTENRILKG